MGPLKDQFPRIFVLDPFLGVLIVDRNPSEKLLDVFGRLPIVGVPNSQWIVFCSMIRNYVFSEVLGRFVWDLDVHGVFSVSSTRMLLDSFFLGGSSISTRWNTLIPIKFKVMI